MKNGFWKHGVIPSGRMAWKTTPNPRQSPVTLRMTATEINDLDTVLVPKYGGNRSATVRAVLAAAVKREKRKKSKES